MLRLAFFKDFKGADTVLLSGRPDDMTNLRVELAPLVSTSSDSIVAVHSLCVVSSKHPAQLFAVSKPSDESHAFLYDESASKKLAALEESGSGHQYFGLPNERVLMVSVGEYDDRFWFKNG